MCYTLYMHRNGPTVYREPLLNTPLNQAEEEVRPLHGGAGGGGRALALLWLGREAGGAVGRQQRRRRHAAELGVVPRRAVGAVVARVAGVARARARAAAPPRGHQPARRQQPALRGAAHQPVLAPRRAPARTRGHLCILVPANVAAVLQLLHPNLDPADTGTFVNFYTNYQMYSLNLQFFKNGLMFN